MKILFDNQIFEVQKYGGISRYFCELFKELDHLEDTKYEVPIKNSVNEYLHDVSYFKNKKIIPHPFRNIRGKTVINFFLDLFDKNSNRNLIKHALKKSNFDIFHPTYYSTYFLKYLDHKPLVITIHDMIHEIYPDLFPNDKGRTVANKKQLIFKADKIIAISENTKKDILKYYDIPENKIQVIYHGNSLIPIKTQLCAYPQNLGIYILYVGSRGIYKNFKYFIQSIAPLLRADRALRVVVAGGDNKKNEFSKSEIDLFLNQDIENQISIYSVSDEILSYLYENAICFVFPTLYEGFGMPILEAFSCNCPAVISKSSSLPEVGGDAAEYFDPLDNKSILNAVKKVIYDNELRDSMRIKGQEQLKKFSWKETARKTMEVYKSLI